jgi:hypothetical protein
MTEHRSTPSKIDRRLTGDPIAIDGRHLQPVARVHGRWGVSGNQQSSGGGGWLRVEPVEVIVRGLDGVESRLALVDPTAEALRAMARVATMVAVTSMGLAALARLLRRRRAGKSSRPAAPDQAR